jgi:hypothetical protein
VKGLLVGTIATEFPEYPSPVAAPSNSIACPTLRSSTTVFAPYVLASWLGPISRTPSDGENADTRPCDKGDAQLMPTDCCGCRVQGRVSINDMALDYAVVYVMPANENNPLCAAASAPVWLCARNRPQYFGMTPPNRAATLNGWM